MRGQGASALHEAHHHERRRRRGQRYAAGGIRALELPPAATHVLICADHDVSRVGERAARDAAARWLAEGRRVRIAMPPQPGSDFNDLLNSRAHAEGLHHAA
jgi:putative DNA primase/helicase